MVKINIASFTRDTAILRKVMRYLVAACPFEVGRTVLVKLVYLADVEFFKQYGRRLSGTSYRFENFGPFDWGIIDESKALVDEGYLTHQEGVTWYGNEKYIYRIAEDTPNPSFDNRTQEVLEGVRQLVEELGSLTSLLDYVHSTEPLISSVRGEMVDFSVLRSDEGVESPISRRLEGSLVLRRASATKHLKKVAETDPEELFFEPDSSYLDIQAEIEDEVIGLVAPLECLETDVDE